MTDRGFTLLEYVVSIAILTMVSAIVAQIFIRYGREQALVTETDKVATLLTDARAKTLYSQNESQYGIHFATTTVTEFTGSSYSPSSPSNAVYILNKAVEVATTSLSSGGSDVVFDQLTGDAEATGTIYVMLLSDMSSTHVIQILGTGVSERIQ